MCSISKLEKKLLPFISLRLQILLFFPHISCHASFPLHPPLCAFERELPQTNHNLLDFLLGKIAMESCITILIKELVAIFQPIIFF
jgi:hypothetical protein